MEYDIFRRSSEIETNHPDTLNDDDYEEWCNDFHLLSPFSLGSKIACHHNSSIAMFSFLSIITLTMFAEMIICRFLEKRWEKNKILRAMLNKLYKELMMLGFVSLCLNFFESVGFITLLFQEDWGHDIVIVFEYVFLTIFFMGIGFILMAVVIQFSFTITFRILSNQVYHLKKGDDPFFLIKWISNRHHFTAIKERFVTINHLESNFRFISYVKRCFAHTLFEVVEVSIRLLVFLWLIFFSLFWGEVFIERRLFYGGIWYLLGILWFVMIISTSMVPICVCVPRFRYMLFLRQKNTVYCTQQYLKRKDEEKTEKEKDKVGFQKRLDDEYHLERQRMLEEEIKRDKLESMILKRREEKMRRRKKRELKRFVGNIKKVISFKDLTSVDSFSAIEEGLGNLNGKFSFGVSDIDRPRDHGTLAEDDIIELELEKSSILGKVFDYELERKNREEEGGGGTQKTEDETEVEIIIDEVSRKELDEFDDDEEEAMKIIGDDLGFDKEEEEEEVKVSEEEEEEEKKKKKKKKKKKRKGKDEKEDEERVVKKNISVSEGDSDSNSSDNLGKLIEDIATEDIYGTIGLNDLKTPHTTIQPFHAQIAAMVTNAVDEEDNDVSEDNVEQIMDEQIERFFLFKKIFFTRFLFQLVITIEAAYLTMTCVYFGPLIIGEDTVTSNVAEKIVLMFVIVIPWFLTLLVLIVVLPFFAILIHVENKTNYHTVKKVIKKRIKRKHKNHYFLIEEHYMQALKELYHNKIIAHKIEIGAFKK